MRGSALVASVVLSVSAHAALQCSSGPTPGLPFPPFPTTPLPTSPSPASPTSPTSPFGPGSGAPVTGGAAAALTSSGGVLDDAHWSLWWSLHRDLFLGPSQLSPAGPTTGATSVGDRIVSARSAANGYVERQILPLLQGVLADRPETEVARSAVFAAAKSARGLDEEARAAVAELLLPFASHPSQSVGEAAIVALGLLGLDAQAPVLAAIARDESTGRAAAGAKAGVPLRKRAFAAYALGLLAEATEREDVRRFAEHHLIALLQGEELAAVDVDVAAALALGWLHRGTPLAPPEDERLMTSTRCAEGALFATVRNPLQHRVVRAAAVHGLVSRLQESTPTVREAWKSALVPLLVGLLEPRAKSPRELASAAVLALGELGDADDDALDERIRIALKDASNDLSDRLGRHASHVALARVAGRPGTGGLPTEATSEVERHLVGVLGRGRSDEKPWAALALGLLGRALEDRGLEFSSGTKSALRSAFTNGSRSDNKAAYALSLGLARDERAVPALIEGLEGADPFVAGRCAVALGLLGDGRAVEPLRAELDQEGLQPGLQLAAAEGLAQLGDPEVVGLLARRLASAGPAVRQSACAAGLGRVRDVRAFAPLLAAASRPTQPDATRAVALDALGRVALPEPLPWKTFRTLALSVQSAPPTLFDRAGYSLLGLP